MTPTMTPTSPPTSRGERTREAILVAATQCFGAHGLADASMETVAEAAGVTKPTVYAHFGSKQALFEAALGAMFQRIKDDPLPDVSTPEEFEQALIGFATVHIEVLLDDDNLGLMRATVAEALRDPAWAEEMAGRVVGDVFTDWLEGARAQGLIAVESVDVAVRTFWALVKGSLFYPVVVGIRQVPDEAERDSVIREAVDVFLTAYRPDK